MAWVELTDILNEDGQKTGKVIWVDRSTITSISVEPFSGDDGDLFQVAVSSPGDNNYFYFVEMKQALALVDKLRGIEPME